MLNLTQEKLKQCWKRLGRIYEPGSLTSIPFGHGLMPVAEHLLGDIYRIYFASRDEQKRSHISCFDFDIRNRLVLAESARTIIKPGELGTFDEHGCVPSWITHNGSKKYLYYVGWNTGGSVPFRLALGLAISLDGANFEKYSTGPIADRSPADPCLVGSCGGLLEAGRWRFWYVSGVDWYVFEKQPRHRYHLKYAESTDGINWHRDGIVAIDFANEAEYAFAAPRVLKTADGYRMWYCFRGDVYSIGYAESDDGVTWTRLDDSVQFDGKSEEWDSQMKCYPYVFEHQNQLYMLYNGNGYGESGIGLAVLDESRSE